MSLLVNDYSPLMKFNSTCSKLITLRHAAIFLFTTIFLEGRVVAALSTENSWLQCSVILCLQLSKFGQLLYRKFPITERMFNLVGIPILGNL